MGSEAAIIDVGANCGDTLAGMVERNPHATYVCIEPDDGFFAYLQDNIARMRASLGTLTVHAVKSLVGNSIGTVSLVGSGGTRHAVLLNGAPTGIASATLDDIIAALPPLAVKLLKGDVDGFDYDVIESAAGLLESQHPLVFFETQCDHEAQLSGFLRTIETLVGLGYSHWTAFDNFGEIVSKTQNSDTIRQLLVYVWKQNQQRATRTIYYFDVLAATHADAALVDAVLAAY